MKFHIFSVILIVKPRKEEAYTYAIRAPKTQPDHKPTAFPNPSPLRGLTASVCGQLGSEGAIRSGRLKWQKEATAAPNPSCGS